MSKLQGNRKIGELPEQKRLRQRLDEIIEEAVAETEHVHNFESLENKVEFPKGRKKKDNL